MAGYLYDKGMQRILESNHQYDIHLQNLQDIYAGKKDASKQNGQNTKAFTKEESKAMALVKSNQNQHFLEKMLRRHLWMTLGRNIQVQQQNQVLMERLQKVSERPKYFVDYRQSDEFQDRVLNQYREMKDRNIYLEFKKRYNTIKSQNNRLEEKLSSQ